MWDDLRVLIRMIHPDFQACWNTWEALSRRITILGSDSALWHIHFKSPATSMSVILAIINCLWLRCRCR